LNAEELTTVKQVRAFKKDKVAPVTTQPKRELASTPGRKALG
jgi:hypothetical protein